MKVGLKTGAFMLLIVLHHLFNSARIFFWLGFQRNANPSSFYSKVLIGIIMILSNFKHDNLEIVYIQGAQDVLVV